MGETLMIVEPGRETPTAPPPAAAAVEPEIPAKRPRRFFANLRFNGLRYLALIAALGLAYACVRLATWERVGPQEATFVYLIAGILLAAAARTSLDILNWAETTRQAVHVERVRAIQRLFDRARELREQALVDWRRIHTVLVDNLSGQPQQIRLFHDHDETDRQSAALLRRALSEELWIRPEGVEAVRRFKNRITTLDYQALGTEQEFLGAFHALLDSMRRDLALAAIGVPLD